MQKKQKKWNGYFIKINIFKFHKMKTLFKKSNYLFHFLKFRKNRVNKYAKINLFSSKNKIKIYSFCEVLKK